LNKAVRCNEREPACKYTGSMFAIKILGINWPCLVTGLHLVLFSHTFAELWRPVDTSTKRNDFCTNTDWKIN
jgi:hypothetical protein